MFLKVRGGKFNRPVQGWGSTCRFVVRSEDSQRVRSINLIAPQGSHRYSRRGHDTIVLQKAVNNYNDFHLCRGLATGIYTTNSPEACQYVAEKCRASVIVVENNQQLQKILQVKANLPCLKAIVQYTGEVAVREDFIYSVSSWECRVCVCVCERACVCMFVC